MRITLLRAGVFAFVLFNAVAAALAYWYHQSLLDYCEPENRYTGGSGLDCLEPYNWPFIYMLGLGWLVVALTLAALVVWAYLRGGEAKGVKAARGFRNDG